MSTAAESRPSRSRTNLLELGPAGLEALLAGRGEPAFRARQLWQWIWQKGARRFDEMTNISKNLRATLAEEARIGWPEVERASRSQDQTFKLLLKLDDGQRVECVLIPEKDHYTLCLSTQVGCALGCTFCSTGAQGFTRNMTAAEIAAQALVARRFLQDEGADLRLRNVVFMGMGEPLHNLEATLASLELLTDPQGLDFSPRRVTVSTVGLPKGLAELGKSGLASLAVSLHAPTQELRARIMPRAAAAMPLPELMAALDAYPLKPRQRITYEYILLAGVNDAIEQAKGLVKLLGQRKAKVNLIACNPGADAGLHPPDPATVEAFVGYLRDHGLTAMLRKSKGQDIAAACGQLKAAHL